MKLWIKKAKHTLYAKKDGRALGRATKKGSRKGCFGKIKMATREFRRRRFS